MFSVLIALLVLGLVCALVLPRVTGFRTQHPSHYASLGPKFDPRIHLAGAILCEGIIYGPLGRVTSRFVAQMHGTWAGDKCRLAEAFVYDSGVHQNRAWDLTLQGDGSLQAKAEDLVGAGIGHDLFGGQPEPADFVGAPTCGPARQHRFGGLGMGTGWQRCVRPRWPVNPTHCGPIG